MTPPSGAEQPVHYQIWVIELGDYLRLPSGGIHLFPSLEAAQQKALEVGGIVQVDSAPELGGFDRAREK